MIASAQSILLKTSTAYSGATVTRGFVQRAKVASPGYAAWSPRSTHKGNPQSASALGSPRITNTAAISEMVAPKVPDEPDNPSMNAVTRDEFDAKLESNRSGLRADFAEFRAEMATSRREQSEQMGRMAEGMAELRGSIVGLSGRVDGSIAGLSGRLDGLTTSMGMLQWVIGSAVAVIGLLFAVGGAWIAYQQLKLAEVPPVAPVAASAPVQAPPNIIINVPASVAPAAVAPAPK